MGVVGVYGDVCYFVGVDVVGGEYVIYLVVIGWGGGGEFWVVG